MQLMAKNAEDRYQSTYGLKADLEKCLQQWQTVGRVDFFLPRATRRDGSIPYSAKIVWARSGSWLPLLAAFERVSQGASEIILVSGHAGIGKSALVREVYQANYSEARVLCSLGKFDQFHRDIPYASLTQAFQSLIRQLLTESEDQISNLACKNS